MLFSKCKRNFWVSSGSPSSNFPMPYLYALEGVPSQDAEGDWQMLWQTPEFLVENAGQSQF
jgi:hypothetical protein